MEIIKRDYYDNETMTVTKKQYPDSRLQASINSDKRIVLRFTENISPNCNA